MLQLKKFLQWNNKQEAFFDVAVKERFFLFINKKVGKVSGLC